MAWILAQRRPQYEKKTAATVACKSDTVDLFPQLRPLAAAVRRNASLISACCRSNEIFLPVYPGVSECAAAKHVSRIAPVSVRTMTMTRATVVLGRMGCVSQSPGAGMIKQVDQVNARLASASRIRATLSPCVDKMSTKPAVCIPARSGEATDKLYYKKLA
jgi:hypothetical protein